MDHLDLSGEEGRALAAQSESHFLDFKSRRVTPAKASQLISAFGNADGGEAFIGIEDARADGKRWTGFDDEESANAHVALLTGLFPIGEAFSYSFLRADDASGLVLRVEVFKNRQVWPDSAGDYWIRRGAQNLRMDREQLRHVEYAKGLVSFEDEKLETGFEFLEDSHSLRSFMNETVPSADPERWMSKQRLIIDDHLTVAGALLFSDEPQPLIPKAAIKVYRYQTSDQETRETLEGHPRTIEGSAYVQIRTAVANVVA